jgi:hypothetical protein
MTLKAFAELSETEQMRIINLYGVLLAERTIDNNKIYLYAVGSFYIELFHELQVTDHRSIRILKVFDDEKLLDIYLSNILIPEVQ